MNVKHEKKPAYLLTALVNFATYIAMSTQPIPRPIADVWSEPTSGLSGRLRLEFEDLQPGLRHAVYLELKNHSLSPVAVTNQPEIHTELFDSAGKPVRTAGASTSGPNPNPQWAVLPRDAYIGFRIDMQTVDVPTREHGVALIAIGGKGWVLGAGEYVLNTAFVFKKEYDGPQNQWIGKLELPPVKFVVTTCELMDDCLRAVHDLSARHPGRPASRTLLETRFSVGVNVIFLRFHLITPGQ